MALLALPRDSQESSPTPQFKSINSSVLSFLYSPTITAIHDYHSQGKTIALTRWIFVGKVVSLLFNMLSRLVIALLPRRRHLSQNPKFTQVRETYPQIKTYNKWNLFFLEGNSEIIHCMPLEGGLTSNTFSKISFQPRYNTPSERSSGKTPLVSFPVLF